MPPQRHWRSYGTEPLPSPAETLRQPLAAFPSWFLKLTCDRRGKDRMIMTIIGGHRRSRVGDRHHPQP
jgi:hypothetical protein